MHNELIWLVESLGFYLLITGFFDAFKYHWQSIAIRKVKLARGHSRKFMNAAIHNDLVRIAYLSVYGYVFAKFDWYLLSSSIMAIIFLLECWYTIYLYYPYRYRGLHNFKRPPMYIFIINSLIPNKYRRKL